MSATPVNSSLFQVPEVRCKIDEALERAILEAKQIRSEVQEEQKTRIPPTLPISQFNR
mgnify:FL=1